MYVMVDWMNDLIEFVMDNEMSNIDSVELIFVVMVKTVVEVEDCCKRIDKCCSEVLRSRIMRTSFAWSSCCSRYA
nr:hypothetical protein [Tanacetum cinerariifolium]